MIRVSGEALVISALLNVQDVEAAQRHGVGPNHFKSHKERYNWLLNYLKQYSDQPSVEAFRAAFPDFPYVEHSDVRAAVDIMLTRYHTRELTEAMDRATMLLRDGDVRAAWELVAAREPVLTTAEPTELLGDMNFLDTYQETVDAIELPVRTLSKCTGGIGPGQLWYVAARTNQGKSAHLCDWVYRAVSDGYRVKFYSLEMTEMEVRARVHAIAARKCGFTGITSFGVMHRTIPPELYKTFLETVNDRQQGSPGLLHVHTPAMGMVTPGVIANSIEDYDLVVVDHVGLMRPDGGGYSTDDWRTAARNSNALKELALSSMRRIVGAAQINREGAHGNRPPDINNLAGTDALGQDADVVVTMRAMAHDVATACATPKNRNGPKQRWWTRFDVDNGNFEEISSDFADQLQIEAEDD